MQSHKPNLNSLIKNIVGGDPQQLSPDATAFLDRWRINDGIKTLKTLSLSLNIASFIALVGTFYFYNQLIFLPLVSLAVLTATLSSISLVIFRFKSSSRLNWLRLLMYISSITVISWFAYFLHFVLQNYGAIRPLLVVAGLIWISIAWIVGALETFFGSKIFILKAGLLIPPLLAFHLSSDSSILPLVINGVLFEVFIILFFYSLNRRRENHALLELKSIDLEAKKEKLAIEAIESELKVARNLQQSLANPPPVQTVNGYRVRIIRKSITSLSRIWVATHRFDDYRMVVAVAESSAEGVTAALVVQTLQALWTSSLDSTHWDPEEWAQTVNRTLIRLSPESPHPLSLAIAYIQENEARLYFSGGVRCQMINDVMITDSVKSLPKPGEMLGLDMQAKTTGTRFSITREKTNPIFLCSGFLTSDDAKVDHERMHNLWRDVKKYGDVIVNNRVDTSDLVMVTIEPASESEPVAA